MKTTVSPILVTKSVLCLAIGGLGMTTLFCTPRVAWAQIQAAGTTPAIPPIFAAINKGDVEAVRAEIDKDATQLQARSRNSTPLIAAVRGGKKEIVALLLEKGADVNLGAASEYDSGNATPLQSAISYNPNLPIITLLLEKGAKLNVVDSQGNTPLLRVLSYGSESSRDVLELFIKKGAKLDAVNREGRSALDVAIGNGRIELVRLLLAGGASLKTRDRDGAMPLHRAIARYGSGETLKLLLEKGADVNAKTTLGDTPLHLASATPSATLDVLIEAGADTKIVNLRGDTALHLALRSLDTDGETRSEAGYEYYEGGNRGTRTRVEGLLANLIAKSDINAKDSFGQTALVLSLIARDSEARSLIFDRTPRTDKTIEVFDAAAQNDVTRLQKLLTEKPFLTFARLYNGMTPLHLSALWGASKTTELLLKKGADVNARDARALTPLHRAINRNAISTRMRDMVTLLLSKGARVDVFDRNDATPLHRALQLPGGDKVLVAQLLDKKAPIDVATRGGQLPLSLAISSGAAKELVPLLLAKGANINARDRNGQTVLSRALEARNVEVMKVLLDAGADISARDGENNSLMGRVVESFYGEDRQRDVVQLLLDKGADINTPSNSGDTLLHRALNSGRAESITWLLERKANVNALDRNGNTPLMRAVMNGNTETVKLLIDKGADLSLKNEAGQNVMALSERYRTNNPGMTDLLRQRGAKE